VLVVIVDQTVTVPPVDRDYQTDKA
jgi:hypothetical protein